MGPITWVLVGAGVLLGASGGYFLAPKKDNSTEIAEAMEGLTEAVSRPLVLDARAVYLPLHRGAVLHAGTPTVDVHNRDGVLLQRNSSGLREAAGWLWLGSRFRTQPVTWNSTR